MCFLCDVFAEPCPRPGSGGARHLSARLTLTAAATVTGRCDSDQTADIKVSEERGAESDWSLTAPSPFRLVVLSKMSVRSAPPHTHTVPGSHTHTHTRQVLLGEEAGRV